VPLPVIEEEVLSAHDAPVHLGRDGATAEEVVELFSSAGLNAPLDEPARLKRMLDEAQDLVVARTEDGLLIGLVRVLTDFSFNAFIADLAVLPDWQGRGLGTRLVEAVVAGHPGVKFVVHPGHDSGTFWAKLGFEPAPTCMAKPRRG
jgi:predicted N-acetyltransferase YhbS